MALAASPLQALQAQRGHLFNWSPVFFALGIGVYFHLLFEPTPAVYTAVSALCICAGVLGLCLPDAARPIAISLMLLSAGFLAAGLRAHQVAAPMLDFRYYWPIEGRIVHVDRSLSDKTRLTLDQVRLARMAPHKTPSRVRVSMHGTQGFMTPEPGLVVMMTGHLSPPQGPAEPGGFDFRRMAWFKQLGAVGYTRSPVLVAAPVDRGAWSLIINRLRQRISLAVRQHLSGEIGAFAAAVTTGDRSAINRDTLDDLRNSNLAHLLAISGLHMGLLTGFVFAALRICMVLVPWVGLRLPVKKCAAVGALLAGGGYYLLSGGNVATEWAFIMVGVMFLAVLVDRRAITLRAVAIAALIVLGLRPETLTEPGFQMSFAATTALVAVFGALRDWRGWSVPQWARPVLAVVISSAVAGLATAPVAAAHFNRIADYGLLANLLSVPLMGLVVMPGAVLAAVLSVFGLGWVGLAVMAPAIRWILGVADWVSGLDGAITPVITPSPYVLPLLAIGFLWLILWRARARCAGLAPAVIALGLWWQTERPPILIADSGTLMGLLTSEGRSLSKPRGDGFTAMSWLENDGDGKGQEVAASRAGVELIAPGDKRLQLPTGPLVQLTGKRGAARLTEACKVAALVVVSSKVEPLSGCFVLDINDLRREGSLAVWPDETGLRIQSARDLAGHRLWSGH